MILKQLIRYTNAPAIEATWVDTNGAVVKCQAYSNAQMALLQADLGAADAAANAALINAVAATYVAPPPPTAAETAALIAAKQDALWRAADKYQSAYISSVAIGLLAMGVMKALPKATAVQTWSGNLWTTYYQRKALITTTSVDNLDFSSAGPMPYSVPELRAELGL